MKKVVLCFVAIIIAVVGVILWNHKNNEAKYTELIGEYMADLASKTKESTCFYEVKYFGKHYEDIYAWVTEKCYYQEENKIVSDSGSSMAYLFYHEDDVIKSFQNPKDGEEYQNSMEELFPLITRNKMEKYSKDESSKVSDSLDEAAKNHFKLDEITYENNIINPSFGAITKLTVDESSSKLKKIATINKREIYGVKNTIKVYDKDDYAHDILDAIDKDEISLDQVDKFLASEVKVNKAEIEDLDKLTIYRSDDYTAIVCRYGNKNMYFGDKSFNHNLAICPGGKDD